MGLGLKSEGEGDLPWGVRLAAGFLDLLAVLALFPWLFSAVLLISTLPAAGSSGDELLRAFAFSGGALGLCIVLLVVVLGSAWFAKYLRARHRPQGSYMSLWKSPLFVLGEPVLITVIIYSILTVLAWCLAKIAGSSGSLIWPVVWTIVGAGSIVARKRLNGDGIDPGSA